MLTVVWDILREPMFLLLIAGRDLSGPGRYTRGTCPARLYARQLGHQLVPAAENRARWKRFVTCAVSVRRVTHDEIADVVS